MVPASEIPPQEFAGGGQPVVTAELHLDNLYDKAARDVLRRACREAKHGPVAIVNRAGFRSGAIVSADDAERLEDLSRGGHDAGPA